MFESRPDFFVYLKGLRKLCLETSRISFPIYKNKRNIKIKLVFYNDAYHLDLVSLVRLATCGLVPNTKANFYYLVLVRTTPRISNWRPPTLQNAS